MTSSDLWPRFKVTIFRSRISQNAVNNLLQFFMVIPYSPQQHHQLITLRLYSYIHKSLILLQTWVSALCYPASIICNNTKRTVSRDALRYFHSRIKEAMNDSCFFTLPEVEVGVVVCVERLKDGNIHMCLFSRSGYRPFINPPPSLGKGSPPRKSTFRYNSINQSINQWRWQTQAPKCLYVRIILSTL